MRKITIFLLILAALALSCKKENKFRIDRPESVIWNPVTQTYLISNVGSGTILALKDKVEFSVFNKSKLNGPKGMSILDNILYVSDVTRLVGFDLKTGKKTFEQKIPDAVFLNDVTADDDKSIYISDSRSNFIVRVVPSTGFTEYFRNPELISPNGLYFTRQGYDKLLYIVSMATDMPIRILNVFTRELTEVPNHKLTLADGITRAPNGAWMISSWADSTVYKFSPDFSQSSRLEKKYQSPADIFFSPEFKELVIPQMETNIINFIKEHVSTRVENK